jgi:hypothetical protein
MPNKYRLSDLERFTIYEYVDICNIPKLYNKDKKLFDLIIKKYDKEREFSLVDLSFLKRNYEKFEITINEVILSNKMNVKELEETRMIPMFYDFNDYVYQCAIRTGNLEVIKWLKDSCNYPLSFGIFNYAAEFGNLQIMKWLRANNCPWGTFTFAAAANSGNLENMKWLKENNCPWDQYTFYNALANGNMDVMKWLYENNCSNCSLSLLKAIDTGNLELIKWLVESDYPLLDFYHGHLSVFPAAASSGNVEIMKWILANKSRIYDRCSKQNRQPAYQAIPRPMGRMGW